MWKFSYIIQCYNIITWCTFCHQKCIKKATGKIRANFLFYILCHPLSCFFVIFEDWNVHIFTLLVAALITNIAWYRKKSFIFIWARNEKRHSAAVVQLQLARRSFFMFCSFVCRWELFYWSLFKQRGRWCRCCL